MGKAILRLVLGVLAGFVVMWVVIAGIELVGKMIWPPPPGIDPSNTADLGAYLAAAPTPALAMIVFAWVVGAWAGGFVAAKK